MSQITLEEALQNPEFCKMILSVKSNESFEDIQEMIYEKDYTETYNIDDEDYLIVKKEIATKKDSKSKYGIIEKTGTVILDVIYDDIDVLEIHNTDELLFRVEKNKMFAIFNGRTGVFITDFIYKSISAKQSLMLVSDKTDKYGYLNDKAEVVIPLKFDCCEPFNNGFAKCFIIKPNGEQEYIMVNSFGDEFRNEKQ